MIRLLISITNFITLTMAWAGIFMSATCYWGRFAPFHWVMLTITFIGGIGASYYTLFGAFKN